MKRFVSIDFLRGFAIVAMIALHVFIVTFDTDILLAALEGEGSPALIVVAIVIIYFASFAGLFIFVSAFGNVASMQKQFERLKDRPDACKIVRNNQVIRGVVVVGISYFITLFLWPYVFDPIAEGVAGLLTWEEYVQEWVTGTIWTNWVTDIYFVDVITFLGFATIIIGVVYTALLKAKREPARMGRALGWIAFAAFAITPVVLMAIRAQPFMNWPNSHHWQGRTFPENVGALLLSWAGGVNQAIFPWIGMSLLGTMMGLDLLDKPVTKQFIKKWSKIGWLMVAIGFAIQVVVAIIAGELDDPAATIFEFGFGTIFGFSGPSTGYMLFAGGGEVLVVVLFLAQVEGKNKALSFARRTVPFRRAGLLALSLYALQFLLYIPVILLELAFGLQPDQQQEELWQSLLMITVCVAITFAIPWAWERVKFKGSLEWCTIVLLGKLSKRKNAADRLDPKGALYDIEPLGQSNNPETGDVEPAPRS